MSGNYSCRGPDASRLPLSLPPSSLLKTSNRFVSVFNKEPSISAPWVLLLEIFCRHCMTTFQWGFNSVDSNGMALRLAMHRYGTQRKPVVARSRWQGPRCRSPWGKFKDTVIRRCLASWPGFFMALVLFLVGTRALESPSLSSVFTRGPWGTRSLCFFCLVLFFDAIL